MTLLEILMAAAIGAIVSGFILFMILFTARSQAVLIPQITNQQAAARAMQVVGDLLRNAIDDPIAATPSLEIVNCNTIRFKSSETPDDVYSKIQFSGGTVHYWRDEANSNELRVIAKGLENLTFQRSDQTNLIEVSAIFKYRKYRGYNQNESERLNGTFTTEIYPRNLVDY